MEQNKIQNLNQDQLFDLAKSLYKNGILKAIQMRMVSLKYATKRLTQDYIQELTN